MRKLNFSKTFILGVFVIMLLVPTLVFAATDVTDETSLKQALANGETEINLKNNIVLSNDVETHGTRTVGLEVKGEGTITINGNGYTLSTPLIVATEVRANTGKNVKVIFNDITVIGAERAIDTRSSGITLELNKTNLSVTKTGNYQALTIGGNAGPITIDINDNSVINGGKYGYGIITFNPVNMTIDDSTVKGYAALYMKPDESSQGSAGSVVTIKNSIMEGNSSSSGSDDNFGTIVLNDNNISINVIDSIVKATNTGTSVQSPIMISADITESTNFNNITIEGESEIVVDTVTESPLVGNYEKGTTDVVIKGGVKSNVEIDEELLEEGTEIIVDETTGEVTVVKKKDNNTTSEPKNKEDKTEDKTEDKNEDKNVVEKNDNNAEIKNPDTFDNIFVSLILSGLSLICFVTLTIQFKKCCK